MHELSIALGIVEVAADESARHGGAKVLAVHITLGPICGVVGDALQSAFELAREHSPLAESHLVINEGALSMHCPECEREQLIQSPQRMCCAVCGAPAYDVLHGREMEITALEIET